MTHTRLDEQLNAGNALRFRPYVGPDYAGADPGILILGEAPYADEDVPSPSDFLTRLITNALKDSAADKAKERWVRYVRNTSAMLTGSYGDSDEIWKNLAYGVFMQRVYSRGKDNRGNVSSADVRQARTAFFHLLDELTPQVVIVWGKTLLVEHWLAPDDSSRVLDAELGVFAFADYPATCIWNTHHPSRDFSYAKEHERWLAVRRIAASMHSED